MVITKRTIDRNMGIFCNIMVNKYLGITIFRLDQLLSCCLLLGAGCWPPSLTLYAEALAEA
jgi:hypothetical protein